jgi:hypothetical protein
MFGEEKKSIKSVIESIVISVIRLGIAYTDSRDRVTDLDLIELGG